MTRSFLLFPAPRKTIRQLALLGLSAGLLTGLAGHAPAALAAEAAEAHGHTASAGTVTEAAETTTPGAKTIGADSASLAADYRQYLKDRFRVELPEAPTKGDFIRGLAGALRLEPSPDVPDGKFSDLPAGDPLYSAAQALFERGILSEGAVQAASPLSEAGAVYFALKAAGLKELAYTYPAAKIQAGLAKLGIAQARDYGLSTQAAQELAASADTGLLPAAWQLRFRPGAPATGEFASLLLGQALAFQGEYKHDIGSTADADIYAKLHRAWQSQSLIQQPALQAVVDEALKQSLITGYNLKDERYNPQFDPRRSLTYGHSEIAHAIQLIGLLRSEGLTARVQLEPKTSAFLYLKEWGEPKVSDDYKVVQIDNGNYIAYAKEYDLSFEFPDAQQKERFNGIILQYAKKNSEQQTGLIAGSWWQPLYYSLPALKDYKEIANNRIDEGRYYAQTFSLKEQTEAIAAGLKKIKSGVTVKSYTFWTDEPFYNYLKGESK